MEDCQQISIPRSAWFRYSGARALALVRDRISHAVALSSRAEIALAGAYHFNNVGDVALIRSARELFRVFDVSSSLHNVYRLKSNQLRKPLVITGGALGTKDVIGRLSVALDRPQDVVLMGIDFAAEIKKFSESSLTFLRSVAGISVRSRRQAAVIGSALDRFDVGWIPDLAFAHPVVESDLIETESGAKLFVFNMAPLFMEKRGGSFWAGTSLASVYQRNMSPLFPYVRRVGPSYISLLNKVLEYYRLEGFNLCHLPFAPEDDLFARSSISVPDVRYLPYTTSVNNVIRSVQQASCFLATRFHAHVFALKLGVPLLSICYAGKCTDLLSDCCAKGDAVVDRIGIVDSPTTAFYSLTRGNPLTMDAAVVARFRRELSDEAGRVLQKISHCISASGY